MTASTSSSRGGRGGVVGTDDVDDDEHSINSGGSDDTDECLEDLLGLSGFVSSFGAITEWNEEEEEVDDDGGDKDTGGNDYDGGSPNKSMIGHGLVDPDQYRNRHLLQQQQQQQQQRSKSDRNGTTCVSNNNLTIDSGINNPNDILFQNAYTVNDNNNGGQIVRPPVIIHDFASQNKGNGLVASSFLPKGSTIYTERSAVAVQLPLPLLHNHIRGDGPQSQQQQQQQQRQRRRPKACQTCFRSLEDYTAVLSSTILASHPNDDNNENNDNDDTVRNVKNDFRTDRSSSFPFPHLWPVQQLQFGDSGNNDHADPNTEQQHDSNDERKTRVDRYGRILCDNGCGALFCSEACYRRKKDGVGSCCTETTVLSNLSITLSDNNNNNNVPSSQSSVVEDEKGDRDNHESSDADSANNAVQAPVVLGTVWFLQMTEWYRRNNNKNDENNNNIDQHWIFQVCGDPEDVQPLELGTLRTLSSDDDDDQISDERISTYTLQPLYDYLVDILQLTKEEQSSFLSIDLLHSLASKAARNGFGFRTQSPFQTYYQSLIRQSTYGGRQAESHARHKAQLALALSGGTSDKFERGMDRHLDEIVCPDLTALFPLTTQCNHSCRPNAQVQSQKFADSLIDVVAVQDIHPGDEILISYISLGHASNGGGGGRGGPSGGRPRRSTFQRRRELSAKYLFTCMCEECTA